MDTPSPAADPAVLPSLIAAGLVSHAAIGDPARLDGEAAALRVLCELAAGPIYRLAPFHYAFQAHPGDPAEAPEARTAALAAAADAALESGAIVLKVSAPADMPSGPASLDAPVLLLRRWGAAAELAAGPELQAMVSARFAVEVAAYTARLAEDLAQDLARELAMPAARDAALAGLGRRLAALEAQGTRIEARLAASMARKAPAGGLEPEFGLALAEFLARIEARAEGAAPARPPVPAGRPVPLPQAS